ncbi:helix-turn-helix domain-containing protein [Vagococcus carniphilus]|uniref:helix-turn-helix domain-containing protein n=1 Tax=Vagococcus carniphilus TaxID=218144 RepID=UPI002891C3EC|nr:helix-turn-helix domain-containing protein [Vagococcus carniphilus]MDT2813684.1 helix-turn-helix domain-containing protein [Vagococcus carniphilus]
MNLKFFVSNKEIMKIEILNEILTSNRRIFLKDLIRKFNVSKNSILRYTAELRDDLNILFEDIKLLYSEDGNYIITTKNSQDHAYLINKVQEYYIENSTLFQILKKILETDWSITKISNSLNFSLSTVYAKIAQLNEFAEPYNIELNLHQNGRFKGNEFNIRYFIYRLVLFQNKTNKDNPFNPLISESFIDITNISNVLLNDKNLTSSEEMRLKMIQGISLHRLKRNHRFLEYDQAFLDDIIYFNVPEFCLFESSPIVSDEQRELESFVFCFFLRSTIFEIESNDKKASIVKKYQQSDLKIARETEFLLEQFSKYFNIIYTDDIYKESYYLLLINFIYFKHTSINLSVFFENDTAIQNRQPSIPGSYTKKHAEIEQFLKTPVIKNYFSEYSEDSLQQLSHILNYIYNVNKQPKKLKIFIQYSKNIHSVNLISQTLMDTFNQEYIEIIKNPAEADLIISDTYEGKKFESNHFYFDNTYDADQYSQLLQYVANIYFKSMFS